MKTTKLTPESRAELMRMLKLVGREDPPSPAVEAGWPDYFPQHCAVPSHAQVQFFGRYLALVEKAGSK